MNSEPYSIIIEGGTIIDGSGLHAYHADIGIRGDRIDTIGNLSGKEALSRIHTEGCFVCPGFIDSHCHTDTNYSNIYPGVPGKVMQGITTDVCGLCGSSAAPVGEGHLKEFIKREEHTLGGVRKSLTMKEFINDIEKTGNSTNMAVFVGNANLRIHAVGYKNVAPDENQMQKMKDLLKQAMEEGAFGLSTGLTYVPSEFSSTEELIELSKVIAEYGGMYNSHMRNEGDRVIESVEEVIEIAEKSGCKGHCSHLKAAGVRNHGKAVECLKRIEEANVRGVDVTFDVYPYTAGSISLSALLPQWILSEGFGVDFINLKKSEVISRIREDLKKDDWENVILQCGYDKIYIGFAENLPQYEGKSLKQIAEELNTDGVEALIQVLIESKAQATIIYYIADENDLKQLIQSPYCVIGTDAYARDYQGPTSGGKPHPRNFSGIPRFIKKYVMEEKLLSMEAGIRRLTGLPASIFGIRERGLIKNGFMADITIFNGEEIAENGTYQDPVRQPAGIRYVIINGKISVENGIFKDIRAGRVLKMKN